MTPGKFMAAKVALDQLDSLDDPAKAALEDVMGDLEQVGEDFTLTLSRTSTWYCYIVPR